MISSKTYPLNYLPDSFIYSIQKLLFLQSIITFLIQSYTLCKVEVGKEVDFEKGWIYHKKALLSAGLIRLVFPTKFLLNWEFKETWKP